MAEKVTIGNATLYLGDCREVVPLLPAHDLLLTDPPYGIGANRMKLGNGKNKLERGAQDWDAAPPPAWVLDMIVDQAKAAIVWGGNYFGFPAAKCWLVWDKQNGESDFADCELAWTNLRLAVRRIYWRWNGMIRKGDDVRQHPTQKPVGVMEWCLGFIPDAKTILDPFMGSGTTLVACAKLGRKGIGIELDPDYFEIACKRVAEAYRQPDLFIAPPEKPTQEVLL